MVSIVTGCYEDDQTRYDQSIVGRIDSLAHTLRVHGDTASQPALAANLASTDQPTSCRLFCVRVKLVPDYVRRDHMG